MPPFTYELFLRGLVYGTPPHSAKICCTPVSMIIPCLPLLCNQWKKKGGNFLQNVRRAATLERRQQRSSKSQILKLFFKNLCTALYMWLTESWKERARKEKASRALMSWQSGKTKELAPKKKAKAE